MQGAAHPNRLRQRLALQRDRRACDRSDPRRRLRRLLRRRAVGCPAAWHEGTWILLAGASPVALSGSEYQARWGEVGRPAGAARSCGRGVAGRGPLARRVAMLARPRRLARRPFRRARRSRDPLAVRRRPDPSGRSARLVRRRGRAGRAGLCARGRRQARCDLEPAPVVSGRRRRSWRRRARASRRDRQRGSWCRGSRS